MLDITGEFQAVNCNRASVDLEPVADPGELARLRALIERHRELTGSLRAQSILANWGAMAAKFIKVFPHDYKRVLGLSRNQQTAASATPLPVPAPAEVVEVIHG